MSESVSYMGLGISLVLPWLLGSIWCYRLLEKSGRWNTFIVLGQGYLAGVFLTTLVIRGWGGLGLPLDFWPITVTLLCLCAAGIPIRPSHTTVRMIAQESRLEKWQVGVTSLLLLLIAYRYSTLFQEITLRPLFPWDAWMNWTPKAVVWFNHGEFTSFVSSNMWLQHTDGPISYTLGAHDAWKYPVTVPVIQLWGMLALGTSDHTLIYLPWLFASLALGLALYGHLRLAGASIPLATLACYALLNLPYINVQTVLAGYADIWVAATFGCAVFALHEWAESRQWPYALLALFLALLCTQLKVPGLIMGGIILVLLLTSTLKLSYRWGAALLLASTACVIIIAAIGIDFVIPQVGRVSVSLHGIALPYIGRYDLSYHPIHEYLGNTIFMMLNWNILGYLFVLLLLISILKRHFYTAPSLALRALALALIFIFFVYYFTDRYTFAQDYTQVNRALLYTIPTMVFYIFIDILQWQRRLVPKEN